MPPQCCGTPMASPQLPPQMVFINPPVSAPVPTQVVPNPLPETAYLSIQTPEQETWKPEGKPRAWKYIVIHHTASKHASVESIHEEHVKRKDANGNPWLGIGYHFVIGNGQGMNDGEIEPTFRWRQQLQGAHAGSKDPVYNKQGIGICLVGNFENHEPTPGQLVSLKKLVRAMKAKYRIDSKNVIGHRDVRATECPGKLFPMDEVANEPPDFQFAEATSAKAQLMVAPQNGPLP